MTLNDDDECFFFCLVFSYLAKFLGSFDSQYETLFGGIDISNEMIGKKILQTNKNLNSMI